MGELLIYVNRKIGECEMMDNVLSGEFSQKVPTALDWANLVDQLPEEQVDIDKDGNYNPKKSPHFHNWMINS